MENVQIADIFDEIADLIELKGGNEFRVRSYRNAARTVRDHSERLEDVAKQDGDFSDLPNIGESTAEKIHEILERGTCKRLEDLRKELPEGLPALMRVQNLGPRKAMQLHKELGIGSLDELKEACEDHQVRELEGMGAKTEEKILEGIETLASTSGRFLYRTALGHVTTLSRHLDKIDSIRQWEIAGSFRRRKETVGDLDILIESEDRERTTEAILSLDAMDQTVSKGKEKVTVRLDSGLQVDFRYFEKESFGAALMYFTGSKEHNIALRKRSQGKGWKLNEYGLFKKDRRLAGKSEEAVYHRFGLDWIPPELREDRGEIDAAESGDLPKLVEHDDIQGDLHSHTDRTDGNNTLEEMAEAAKERGYHYLAITNHSQSQTMNQGLDEKELAKHAEAIRKLNEDLDDFWLMAGIEVDILKDGSLDLDEDALAELDWVVASVHSHFDLGQKAMTDRLVNAARSGVVHAIGHLCGRIIGKRDLIVFDTGKVFEACKEHGVAIEINAQPDRLDPPDTYCKEAMEAGLDFTISTDAHKRSDLDFIEFGLGVARRGWLEKKHILNTKTIKQLRKRLQGK